jgi:2,4-dienoyl-CoA reductase-like NADH-dependent reductase (Old Yellow Enzyme family)
MSLIDQTSASQLFEGLEFSRGPSLKNRFVLAPLTNTQSNDDGTLSDVEFRWLTMRAQGGFGQVRTCAIAVEERGRGYPGQLGAWTDSHIHGLSHLSEGIKAHGTVACAQLAHSGPRSLRQRVGVMGDSENDVVALTNYEVQATIKSFVDAAKRSEKAGFDGVEIHAAHGFLPAQFLSPEINTRSDEWGGSLNNRTRFVREILKGIRAETAANFQLGLRLSPERFGLRFGEVLVFAQDVMKSNLIDWLDMSLWDVFKAPEEDAFAHKPLIDWLTELDRANTRLGVAGNILDRSIAERALLHGADYVDIGKAAILAHDFPKQVLDNPDFQLPERPVSEAFLRDQGLGSKFISYMRDFGGFV